MIRTIIKVGNSEGITIPASTMRAYKLKAGDKVEVYISEPGGSVKDLELRKIAEKILQEYGRDLKNPKKHK